MGVNDFIIANLSGKEMETIEHLENELGVTLVAYEKAVGKSNGKENEEK